MTSSVVHLKLASDRLNATVHALHACSLQLWPPCVADVDIIFLPCDFYLSIFFPRLILAVADWMSIILRHMMWP